MTSKLEERAKAFSIDSWGDPSKAIDEHDNTYNDFIFGALWLLKELEEYYDSIECPEIIDARCFVQYAKIICGKDEHE